MPLTLDGNGTISGLGDINGHDLETNTLVNVSDATFAAQAVGRATLFIDASTNRVGINTTTPSRLLEISDNDPIVAITDTANSVDVLMGVFSGTAFIGTESADRFDINAGGGARVTVLPNGKVGIGTTTPDRFLSVSAADGLLARFIGPTNNLFIANDRPGLIDLFTSGSNDDLTLGTQSTEVVRVTSNGRVGIGVSSPAEKLDIGPEAVDGAFKLAGQSVAVTSNGLTIDYQPNIGSPGSAVDRVRYFAEPRSTGDGLSQHIFYAYTSGSRQESCKFTGNGLTFPNGKGIDFSATEGSGASSSLLDDYEEGSWTPEVRNSSSSTGVLAQSYNANGRYIKIGNQVWITCQITNIDCKNWTSNSNMFVHGYPFVTSANNQSRGAVLMQNVTFADQVDARLLNTRAYSYYDDMVSGANFSQLSRDDFAVNSRIEHNLVYQAV